MPPRFALPRPSPRELENAIHPFDKLVIGLPTAMEEWRRMYGPLREWCKLPPNPLLVNPVSEGGEESSASRNCRLAASSRATTSGPPSSAALHPPPSTAPRTNEPHFQKSSAAPAPKRNDALYCDACQRDFATQEKYAAHMETHIYCTVAGCRFTCRKGKPWRMEEHMELLHNRPDAPNLVDTHAYLEQRKRRFPTQDAVKIKVEELYYKAARGVILPDERRRWMQQHGIVIRKRPRTESSFIVRGELPTGSRSPSAESSACSSSSPSRRSSRSSSTRRQRRSPRKGPHEPPQRPQQSPPNNNDGGPARFIQPLSVPSYQEFDPTAVPTQPSTKSPRLSPAENQGADADASSSATAGFSSMKSSCHSQASPAGVRAAPAHPTKIIPLGPNGTLTPRQRVQLVRERYAAAKEVPQFYVCHRCGIKGEHWVADCPTKGDGTYDRHVVWGEAKLSPAVGRGAKPRREHAEKGSDVAEDRGFCDPPPQGTTETAAPSDSCAEQAVNTQSQVDAPTSSSPGVPSKALPVAPQEEVRANATPLSEGCATAVAVAPTDDSDDDAPPPLHSAAPPPDAPKEVTRMMAPVAAAKRVQPHRREPVRRPPPPPTLYERLTEEARMDEQGVLLQALRFFVARDFFQDAPQP
ncbi:hypothetical protein JKF63_00616 [Porcisia hertigi]|uniref:C2H2-type domain-containing protein n=1 Tax=Porcisia hertigi TaxID=2761500 RepID=A0A836I587_9TRYP|nr:hypothetical protein JKF63_00616 [Porcisia hertigi]